MSKIAIDEETSIYLQLCDYEKKDDDLKKLIQLINIDLEFFENNKKERDKALSSLMQVIVLNIIDFKNNDNFEIDFWREINTNREDFLSQLSPEILRKASILYPLKNQFEYVFQGIKKFHSNNSDVLKVENVTIENDNLKVEEIANFLKVSHIKDILNEAGIKPRGGKDDIINQLIQTGVDTKTVYSKINNITLQKIDQSFATDNELEIMSTLIRYVDKRWAAILDSIDYLRQEISSNDNSIIENFLNHFFGHFEYYENPRILKQLGIDKICSGTYNLETDEAICFAARDNFIELKRKIKDKLSDDESEWFVGEFYLPRVCGGVLIIYESSIHELFETDHI